MITGEGNLQQRILCFHKTFHVKPLGASYVGRPFPSERAGCKHNRAPEEEAYKTSCLRGCAQRKCEKRAFAAEAQRRAFSLSSDVEDEDAEVDGAAFLEDEDAGACTYGGAALDTLSPSLHLPAVSHGKCTAMMQALGQMRRRVDL